MLTCTKKPHTSSGGTGTSQADGGLCTLHDTTEDSLHVISVLDGGQEFSGIMSGKCYLFSNKQFAEVLQLSNISCYRMLLSCKQTLRKCKHGTQNAQASLMRHLWQQLNMEQLLHHLLRLRQAICLRDSCLR